MGTQLHPAHQWMSMYALADGRRVEAKPAVPRNSGGEAGHHGPAPVVSNKIFVGGTVSTAALHYAGVWLVLYAKPAAIEASPGCGENSTHG
jgi:hypothetical protein